MKSATEWTSGRPLKSRLRGADNGREDPRSEDPRYESRPHIAKILVVEDNADLLALVARRLRREGHRVQETLLPLDALALVRAKGAPDLVVLDVEMPVMNGLELLVAIRECTDRPDLPAVFLSGRVEPEDVAGGRALGAIYLTKPFVASALNRAIESALAANSVVLADDW